MKFSYLSLLFAVALLASCGHNKGTAGYYKVGQPYKIADKTYTPKEEADYDETGMASWYGSDFHKKATANGGTFDRHALTAAHRTLPLPSMVRVTNLANNKTLIVMVNDRGPFAKDRILDLSERSADILGFKNKGVAKVRVQYLPGQTKRLLADLPGTKAKAAAANIELEKTSMVSKFSKAAADAVVVSDEYNAEQGVAADAATKNTVTNSVKTEGTTAIESTPVDADAPVYSDAGDDAMVTAKPAAPIEEKVPEISAETHFIQAGIYSVANNAKRVEKKLASLGIINITKLKINGKLLYKVTIGPIMDKKVAELTLKKTITLGHPDAMLVNEGGKS